MLSFKKFITKLKEQTEDYRGEHTAPGKDDGSPLHDVTLKGSYPEDIYSHNGLRYYGDGTYHDSGSMSVIHASRNKPNARVKIYRAVPKILTRDERIFELEQHKKHILKHGKIPPGVKGFKNTSDYFDYADSAIQRLKSEPETKPEEKIGINKGDWVTLNRSYAVDHGESNLGGKGHYKILSKTVPAKHVYTDGNSINEWGYHPD